MEEQPLGGVVGQGLPAGTQITAQETVTASPVGGMIIWPYLQQVLLPARAVAAVVRTPAIARAVAPAHRPTEPRKCRRDRLLATFSASLLVFSNIIHLLLGKRIKGFFGLSSF